MRRSTIIGLVCAAWCALAPPALAAEGDPYATACLTRAAATGCANTLTSYPVALAISPDGRQVYAGVRASGGGFSGLQIFDRDPATGAVVPRGGRGGCFAASTTTACTSVGLDTLGQVADIAVSPDGRNVFLTSVGAGGVVLNFARDAASGALARIGCTGSAVPGCPTPIIGPSASPAGLAVSPDSANVYVRTTNGMVVLDRNPVTLALVQKGGAAGCFAASVSGCTASAGLTGTGLSKFAVAPDGAHVYAAFDGGVSIFPRGPGGALAPASTVSGAAMTNAGTVAVSADGRSVYLGAAFGIFAFTRNSATGALTANGCIAATGDCTQAPAGVSGISGIAITPDGSALAAAAATSGTLTFYARDPATGALTRRGGSRACFTTTADGCETLAGLGGFGQVVMDGSGLFVYAAAFDRGMLATLVRDFAPVCQSGGVNVPFNTAVTIPLTCADANGDPFVVERVAGPSAGQLGEISGGRVLYNPFGNYAGPDAFTFRAVTPSRSNAASAPATIGLNVLGPPAPSPGDGGGTPVAPKGKPRLPTLTSGVAHQWNVKGTRLTLVTLRVTQQFPKGWKAKIVCKGKKCPFKSKSLKAGKVRRGVSNVIGSLSAKQRRFRAGQTVEVWISAPNYNTKVARFALKKSKIPQIQPYCVRPGEKQLRRTCT